MENEIFNEEGNFVDGWMGEEYAGEKSLENIKNLPDLVKNVVNAQHTIGKKGVIVPGEDASEDEINTYHKSLGRPDKATDYKFNKAELPDGMEFDDKMDIAFREMAYKHGMNNASASAMSDWYNKFMIDAHNANNASIVENQKESLRLLEKKWGKDNDANWKASERAFKTAIPDEVNQKMFGKFGDNPIMIEAFFEISKNMREDKMVAGDGVGVGIDAIKEIQKIKLDPKHAFNVANDAGHDAAVVAMNTLYKQAYPNGIPKK